MDALQHYSEQSGNSVSGHIGRYLLGRMPNASPATLNELDQAAENLAQFFEGYRQVYSKAASDIRRVETEITANTSLSNQLKKEVEDYHKLGARLWDNESSQEWHIKGDDALARLRKIGVTTVAMDSDSKHAATDLLEKLGNAGRWTISDQTDREARRGPIFHIASSEERLEKFERRYGIPRPYSPPMTMSPRYLEIRSRPKPVVSNYLHTLSVSTSSRASADARIRENLGYADATRLLEAVRSYVDASKVGDPTATLLKADAVKRDLEWDIIVRDAVRTEYQRIPTYMAERKTAFEKYRQVLQPAILEGIDSAMRWGFWKYLKEVAPLLEDQIKSPTMLVRAAKLQTKIIRFAKEDLAYLPVAAQALGTESPAEIEKVRQSIQKTVCEFGAETGATIFPLPKPFENSPLVRLFPPKPSCQ